MDAHGRASRSGRDDEKTSRYVLIDDALGLLWLVNLGCIDLNPWQSLADAPDQPTHVLFDLDPAEGLPFARVVETALLVREALEAARPARLPADLGRERDARPGADRPRARLGRRAPLRPGGLGGARAGAPDLVTTERVVAKRGPRVYLDAHQNGRGRSIAGVYSVRPRPARPWRRRCAGTRCSRPRARRVDHGAPSRGGSSARATWPRASLTDLQALGGAVARLGAG